MAMPSSTDSADVLNCRRQVDPSNAVWRRPARQGGPLAGGLCRSSSDQCCLPAPTQRNPRRRQHVAEASAVNRLTMGKAEDARTGGSGRPLCDQPVS
jgi:hypothetical protein